MNATMSRLTAIAIEEINEEISGKNNWQDYYLRRFESEELINATMMSDFEYYGFDTDKHESGITLSVAGNADDSFCFKPTKINREKVLYRRHRDGKKLDNQKRYVRKQRHAILLDDDKEIRRYRNVRVRTCGDLPTGKSNHHKKLEHYWSYGKTYIMLSK